MRKLNFLMTMRICDLNLNLQRSHLYRHVRQLHKDLTAKGILFRPICYFADEWFVPEGDPVIGIPFYLANKNLIKLEKKMMGEAEGEKPLYFNKLLRHEAGHALSYAYRLYRKKAYKRVFGVSTQLFSDIYDFDIKSKDHVLHLHDYYAQSHPDEDFAETFAVWLSLPRRKWEKQYKGWAALKKLYFVDELMTEIQGRKPAVRFGEKMCHVSTLKYTLWTYYMRRRSLVEHHRRGHL